MKRTLHVKDIILITLIAIIFGFIYVASDNIYNFLTLILTPIGYGPLANDITMGIWCMACLLYTSPSPRDISGSRMPSSA